MAGNFPPERSSAGLPVMAPPNHHWSADRSTAHPGAANDCDTCLQGQYGAKRPPWTTPDVLKPPSVSRHESPLPQWGKVGNTDNNGGEVFVASVGTPSTPDAHTSKLKREGDHWVNDNPERASIGEFLNVMGEAAKSKQVPNPGLAEFLTTPNSTVGELAAAAVKSQHPMDKASAALATYAEAARASRTGRFQVTHPNLQSVVPGVGPDAPTETNERGASQSKTMYAMTSLDARALLAVARVAAEGDAKHGKDNWRGIGARDHINHAIVHFYAYLAGDITDEHLAHAACRALMALAVVNEGNPHG